MNDTTHVRGQRRRATIRTWAFFGAGLAAAVMMMVLIVVACQAPDRGSHQAETGGVLGTASSPGVGDRGRAGDLGGAGDEPDGGSDTDSGQAGAPDPPSGQDDPVGQPDPIGPVIDYFRVLQQPQCPGGTNLNPIEGQPVALEWNVTGADGDEVSLSIDGPGVYNTYPAEDSDVINFPCEGDEGDIQEHTYLLTAVGNGEIVTETLVVTAVVQQVSDVSTTEQSG